MGFEINRFEILVEPKPYFTPGQRVNSMLIIKLRGHLKCKNILITAVGLIMAKFYQRNETPGHTYFMSIPISLPDLVSSDVLETGLYRIPFHFYLQHAYFPTFKVAMGFVSYYVEAIIDNGLFTDTFYTAKQDFTVKVQSNSLRSPQHVCRPIASVREKLVREFGFKTGSVRLSAHLDTNTYYGGQSIEINYYLGNRSPKMVHFIPQLVRHVTFKKGHLSLENEDNVAVGYSGGQQLCLADSSQSDIVRIPVPHDTMPTIITDLLDIKYCIALYVNLDTYSIYFDDISIIVQ